MNDELEIIKKILSPMEEIINAIPGERFVLKEADTLIIIERRMADSDLKKALHDYDRIFTCDNGVDIEDITRSMMSFVRIRMLVNEDQTDFDARLLRQLIKEYKAQMSKVINIIKLSRINAMSAAAFEREKIEVTIQKNEAFLEGFEKEIESLEKQIERLPKEPEAGPEVQKKQETVTEPQTEKKPSLSDKFRKLIEEKDHKKDVADRLRVEECKKSKTRCVELPFYDGSLSFTESFVCKDIPEYTLFKRKNDVYFGLTKNVKQKVYDNSDGSLLELTEATDDFIQYMSEDLLTGEYELSAYEDIDKESLRMYFDFVCVCFGVNIGKTLSIREYLKFKLYYNDLATKLLQLEEVKKTRYYAAEVLAEKYRDIMDIYDMALSEDTAELIEMVLTDRTDGMRENLKLIHDNHVVSEESKHMICDLSEQIELFNKPREVQKVEEQELKLSEEFMAALSNQSNKILVQFFNEEGMLTDEGVYAVNNMDKALEEYKNRPSSAKKIGIRTAAGNEFYEEE